MSRDVIIAEDEIQVAVNTIIRYEEFLLKSISDYISTLGDIQEKGINDDLVCARLSEIAGKIRPHKLALYYQCQRLKGYSQKELSEVEKADNFEFPSSSGSGVFLSILSNFL